MKFTLINLFILHFTINFIIFIIANYILSLSILFNLFMNFIPCFRLWQSRLINLFLLIYLQFTINTLGYLKEIVIIMIMVILIFLSLILIRCL